MTQSVTIVSPSKPTIGLTPGGSISIRSRGSAMRRARLVGPDGREYLRRYGTPFFTVDPSPGITLVEHVAPGTYTLQIVGADKRVEDSAQVEVREGQMATIEI